MDNDNNHSNVCVFIWGIFAGDRRSMCVCVCSWRMLVQASISRIQSHHINANSYRHLIFNNISDSMLICFWFSVFFLNGSIQPKCTGIDYKIDLNWNRREKILLMPLQFQFRNDATEWLYSSNSHQLKSSLPWHL